MANFEDFSTEELQQKLRHAHNAGDKNAAARFAQVIRARAQGSDVPGIVEAAQPEEKQPRTFRDYDQGLGEAALTLGTGATSGAAGYLAGTSEGLARFFMQQGFSAEDAARLAQQRAAEYTYMPRSEVGQEIVGAIGKATEWMPPIAGGAPQFAQMPIKQAARGAVDVARSVDIPQIPQGQKKQAVGAKLATGQTSADTAGFRLSDKDLQEKAYESGQAQYIEGVDEPEYAPIAPTDKKQIRVEKFPEAQNLIKSGFDEKFVAGVQNYTKDESRIAGRMARIKEAEMNNPNVVKRPLSEVGNVVSDQVKILTQAKNSAGKKIGAALNEMEGKQLDYGTPLNDWRKQLESEGIEISDIITDDGVKWDIDYRGSKFAGDTGAQKLIEIIADRLDFISKKHGSIDKASPKDLHDLKKLIDYHVDWSRKAGDTSLTSQAEGLATSLRGGINDVLKAGSPKYEAANADYARAIRPLVQMNESTGSKINFLDDSLSPDKVGLEMRRLTGNWNITEDLRKAAKNLSLEARSRGYDKNINLDRLVILSGDMDKKFGLPSSKSTSLGGIMQATARGDTMGAVIEATKEGLKKTMGKDDAKAISDLKILFDVKSK